MRIATWNVNSIRTRKSLVIDFLHTSDIDVVLMQETKCRDDQFPFADFDAAGYEVAHFGLNQWNCVGIASRLPLQDIEQGFPGMPGFSKDPAAEPALEARALSATVEGFASALSMFRTVAPWMIPTLTTSCALSKLWESTTALTRSSQGLSRLPSGVTSMLRPKTLTWETQRS